MPFFSIIIPVYNVKKYLSECVRSVLKQSFKDWEMILIDDGSTDNSGKICADFARQSLNIRVIRLKKNFGAAIGKNLGIKAARGEFLMFVDSDDYLISGCLKKIAALIKKNSGAEVVIGKFICRPEKGGALAKDHEYDRKIINNGPASRVIEQINNISGFSGVCWRYIIRRDFVIKKRLLFSRIKIYEDQTFMAKMLILARRFILYDDFFYCYRTRPLSLSKLMDLPATSSCLAVMGELAQFMKEKRLTGIKKDFVSARIKYALDLFVPRLLTHNRAEILQLAEIADKYKYHLKGLNSALGFEMLDNIKKSGSFQGLINYKETIAKNNLALVKNKKNKDLYIFCAGASGRGMAKLLLNSGYKIKGFLDNNKALNNATILGHKVTAFPVFASNKKIIRSAFVIICPEQKEAYQEIYGQLKQAGLNNGQITRKTF